MENGLISIGIFLLVQLIGGVAWASAINTKMNFMLEITKEFMKVKDKYSTKEEVSTALMVAEKAMLTALTTVQREGAVTTAHYDKEFKAVWSKIDLLAKGK